MCVCVCVCVLCLHVVVVVVVVVVSFDRIAAAVIYEVRYCRDFLLLLLFTGSIILLLSLLLVVVVFLSRRHHKDMLVGHESDGRKRRNNSETLTHSLDYDEKLLITVTWLVAVCVLLLMRSVGPLVVYNYTTIQVQQHK